MATLGSGTSQIPNFHDRANLTAEDVDLAFAAVVELLGGVKWLDGAASRSPGAIGPDNFVAGSLGLGNNRKKEPYSQFIISGGQASGYSLIAFGPATGPAAWLNSDRMLCTFIAPQNMRLDAMYATFHAASASPAKQNVSLSVYVDGVEVANQTVSDLAPDAKGSLYAQIGKIEIPEKSVITVAAVTDGYGGDILNYGIVASALHVS